MHYCKFTYNTDAEEEKKKQELREQAKRELSDWYRHYEEQIQLANQRNSFVLLFCFVALRCLICSAFGVSVCGACR